jgi:hypothetical protein
MKKIIYIIIFSIACFTDIYGQETTEEKISDLILSKEELELFRERTEVKIDELQDNLSVLGSKDEIDETKILYKELTLKLFMNMGETVTMETSYIKDGEERRKRIPMPTYLDRLSKLNYAKVDIRSSKSCYVSNFYKKGDDEKGQPIYTATATIYQEFIGYNAEGKAIYKDTTKKTIEIEVRKSQGVFGERWIILLGDVSVAETSSR